MPGCIYSLYKMHVHVYMYMYMHMCICTSVCVDSLSKMIANNLFLLVVLLISAQDAISVKQFFQRQHS